LLRGIWPIYEIGKNSILAGKSAISGSVKLGENVILAGDVGVADNLKIGSNSFISAGTKVFTYNRGVVNIEDIKIGDEVKKNDILFTLDSKDVRRNIKRITEEIKYEEETLNFLNLNQFEIIYRDVKSYWF